MTLRRPILAVAAFVGLTASAVAEPARPLAVVELFTSQGCSSCPPGDAYLGELAGDRRLVALSYNVDIWDYLGWKDTLASAENTARQRGYADARGDRSIYTPQMVVNGRTAVIGSDRRALESALAEEVRAGETLPVAVEVSRNADVVTVSVGAATAPKATVWAVYLKRRVEVTIERGENKGARIAYTNVARRIQPIGMWKGEAMSVEMPASDLARMKADAVAVIVQAEAGGRPGRILGAALFTDPSEPLAETAVRQ